MYKKNITCILKAAGKKYQNHRMKNADIVIGLFDSDVISFNNKNSSIRFFDDQVKTVIHGEIFICFKSM